MSKELLDGMYRYVTATEADAYFMDSVISENDEVVVFFVIEADVIFSMIQLLTES